MILFFDGSYWPYELLILLGVMVGGLAIYRHRKRR